MMTDFKKVNIRNVLFTELLSIIFYKLQMFINNTDLRNLLNR